MTAICGNSVSPIFARTRDHRSAVVQMRAANTAISPFFTIQLDMGRVNAYPFFGNMGSLMTKDG